MRLLLDHIPTDQVKITKYQGSTPIMIASQMGYVEFVCLLLAHSPEVQVVASDLEG